MDRGQPSNGDAKPAPGAHQSKLRAKREERLQQKIKAQEGINGSCGAPPEEDIPGTHAASSSHGVDSQFGGQQAVQTQTSTTTARSTGEDARKRERAEARRLLMAYNGTVWDAVRSGDVVTLKKFFFVEGASRLLRLHSKEPEEGGRTLLHTAAWWGQEEAVQFLLTSGASVDEIDTTASRTTALIGAARAGQGGICALLVRYGADATHKDIAGDTAFHWAARRGHGTALLQMALELDIHDRRMFDQVWTIRNGKGKTPMDMVRGNALLFPLLQRRLGARFLSEPKVEKQSRRSRVPFKTAAMLGASSRSLTLNPSQITIGNDGSRPTTSDGHTPMSLSGVDALGLGIDSFAYKARDSIPSQ